jgi:hypothetical protein
VVTFFNYYFEIEQDAHMNINIKAIAGNIPVVPKMASWGNDEKKGRLPSQEIPAFLI